MVEPLALRTQDQNGGAERSGGVIKEKARAMRGNLPTALWCEITRAAVYLYNRTPRYQNRWKTPYELYYGRKPGLEHLKTYGCKAFAMTPDAQQKKNRLKRLHPRVWIGYLVGYASSNIYRIWIPWKGKVIAIRDVIFDEARIFDGREETLRDEVREADLSKLAKELQKIALLEHEDLLEKIQLPVSVRQDETWADIQDEDD